MSNIASLCKDKKFTDVISGVLQGDEVNARDTNRDQYTALLYCAFHNEPELFSWLVQRGADISITDVNEKNCLHVAVKYGSAAICRQLLLEDVDTEQKDAFGRTPEDFLTDRRALKREVEESDLKEVSEAFSNWKIIRPVYFYGGIAALRKLAASRDQAATEAKKFLNLLEKPLDISHLTSNIAFQVPKNIHCFLSYSWFDKEIVLWLYKQLKDAGINVWKDEGILSVDDINKVIDEAPIFIGCISPRYCATLNCTREIIHANSKAKVIIPAIVDPESGFPNWPPKGPTGYALVGKLYADISNKSEENLSQIINQIRTVCKIKEKKNLAKLAFQQQWEEFVCAIISGNDELEQVLEEGTTMQISSMKFTPLLHCIYYGKVELVSWLLQQGANINCVDVNQRTALHIAARYSSPLMCRILLLQGAEANKLDVFSRLPTDIVNQNRSGDTKAELLNVFKYWEEIHVEYKSKSTQGLQEMVDAAEDKCHPKIVDILNYLQILQQVTHPSEFQSDLVKKASVERSGGNNSANSQPAVFFSYCWADCKAARPLAFAIQKAHSTWLDIQQMAAGNVLYGSIEQGMRGCDVVVSCISERYVKSLNCTREIKLATMLNKKIIFVHVDNSSWPPSDAGVFKILTGATHFSLDSTNQLPTYEIIAKISAIVKALKGRSALTSSARSNSSSLTSSKGTSLSQLHLPTQQVDCVVTCSPLNYDIIESFVTSWSKDIKVWIDTGLPESATSADHLALSHAVSDQVSNCKLFIACISLDYVNQEHFIAAFQMATDTKREIILIVVDSDCSPPNWPPPGLGFILGDSFYDITEDLTLMNTVTDLVYGHCHSETIELWTLAKSILDKNSDGTKFFTSSILSADSKNALAAKMQKWCEYLK